MSQIIATAIIYYRDLPTILLDAIQKDSLTNLTKDGLSEYEGHKVPRCTIRILSCNDRDKDSKRIAQLERLIDGLCSNNQIVSGGIAAAKC